MEHVWGQCNLDNDIMIRNIDLSLKKSNVTVQPGHAQDWRLCAHDEPLQAGGRVPASFESIIHFSDFQSNFYCTWTNIELSTWLIDWIWKYLCRNEPRVGGRCMQKTKMTSSCCKERSVSHISASFFFLIEHHQYHASWSCKRRWIFSANALVVIISGYEQ